MFFSPELLARRDSGFGLLWLAATLGSKSTFKKLPKKSVLTADISELCELIAQPPEPLALRLSSNLMIGVARVYKVKQEIFMLDVSNCAATLKKVVREIDTPTINAQLLMPQPNVRASALTIPSKGANHIVDLNAFLDDWNDYLNIHSDDRDDGDADFDPTQRGQKKSKAAKNQAVTRDSAVEEVRAQAHTLNEHYDHLLSTSFDVSFQGSGGGFDPSSSQVEPAFAADDQFFPAMDDMDFGGLGDELARELGEGWGNTPLRQNGREQFGDGMNDFHVPEADDFPPVADGGFGYNNDQPMFDPQDQGVISPEHSHASPSKNQRFSPSLQPLQQPESVEQSQETRPPPERVKRTRLLLDARTELSDEELKLARAQYVQIQSRLRAELQQKQSNKEHQKLIDSILWGVPSCIKAPDLAEFWQDNFSVQVEARTGVVHIHGGPEGRPAKRRKTQERPQNVNADNAFDMPDPFDNNVFPDLEPNMGPDYPEPGFGDDFQPLRSSEEPGQGRQQSRPPSGFGGLFDIPDPGSQSQKSSLFPWDNAGFASSSAGAGPLGSDRISVDKAETRLRRSSAGRSRESSANPGSALGMSPLHSAGRLSHTGIDDDFAFDLQPENQSAQLDSQKSDMNLITLERNSFNFLEYVKMQHQTLSRPEDGLSFYTIAPQTTSSRHVAAAAFYHCLVLATKDLLRLDQEEEHGLIRIDMAVS